MATTTRAIVEERFSQTLDDHQSMTSDASGNSTTVVSDTNLADLTEDEDGLKGWVEWTSGTTDGDIRRIKRAGYALSTEQLTVNDPFSGTPSNSATYLLHGIDPILKRNACQRAIELLLPYLYLPIVDESLVVDNILANADFESALSGGSHPSWTEANGVTITLETTRVFHGTSSNKMVSHASTGAGQVYQEPDINIQDLIGKLVTFKARVYSTVANEARIRIDWDGTAFENSDYHTGADEWQLLTAEAAVPDSATRVRFICEVIVGTKTAFYDATWAAIDPLYRLTLPTSIIKGPYTVEQQYSESEVGTNGRYYPVTFQNPPRKGRRLRLKGKGLLTRPSTDTATVEIGDDKLNLIVARALEWYYAAQMRSPNSSGDERAAAKENMLEARGDVAQLITQVRSDRMAASKPDGLWHYDEDASGRYLVFTDSRTATYG